MAREFRLPDIGEGLTEAEIVRWLVPVGERVEIDQPIIELETDKAVVEIPSPFAGIVLSYGGAEGDTVEVGQILVTIGEEGERPAQPAQTTPSPPPSDEREDGVHGHAVAPIVGTLSDEAETLAPSASTGADAPAAIQALPLVRKLARDHGIDLSQLHGSGPGGRITREDVESAIEAASGRPHREEAVETIPVGAGHGVSDEAQDQQPEQMTSPSPVSPRQRRDDERRPMTRLRRTIAANMAKSWSDIPHVTTFEDVDATRLLEVRHALGDRHEMSIPVEALVIRAVLPAIDEFPEFNATIDGDDLVLHGTRDIGIAVDTPEGLMVAVIRDAASKSVLDLAAEVRRLGEGARARSLGPDELTGQTFTVSNIGAVGGGHGTPIVPYGTTAILSVGRARLSPVAFGEDLGIAPVMPLSLSYDHRVVDGAVGRRFMALVIENLEEPALFLAV